MCAACVCCVCAVVRAVWTVSEVVRVLEVNECCECCAECCVRACCVKSCVAHLHSGSPLALRSLFLALLAPPSPPPPLTAHHPYIFEMFNKINWRTFKRNLEFGKFGKNLYFFAENAIYKIYTAPISRSVKHFRNTSLVLTKVSLLFILFYFRLIHLIYFNLFRFILIYSILL